MNKKRVDGWILPAKEALETCGIAKDGKIDSTYRSHISSFGSAVAGGSLVSAVAFFCEQGNAKVSREKLLQAMYLLIEADKDKKKKEPHVILLEVCEAQSTSDRKNYKALKEKFEDASLALKRAMNFFDLENEPGKKQDKEPKPESEPAQEAEKEVNGE